MNKFSATSKITTIGGNNTVIVCAKKSTLIQYVEQEFPRTLLMVMKNHQIFDSRDYGTVVGFWGRANGEYFAVIFR